jgi:hypothetical protein
MSFSACRIQLEGLGEGFIATDFSHSLPQKASERIDCVVLYGAGELSMGHGRKIPGETRETT